MDSVEYKPIGIINTPNVESRKTPIQPGGAKNIKGEIEVFKKFSKGLKDLEGFSHIILIYHFHKSKKCKTLKKKPYMDDKKHGVFAMRGPSRPNPIGIPIFKLNKIEGNKLFIENVDILDGTPLLDIKPYVPEFDIHKVEKNGWLEDSIHKLQITKDDGRFSKQD